MCADSCKSKVFVSYSRNDRFWLNEMHDYLKPLDREEKISLWDDTNVIPGQDWKKELEQALQAAEIAIFLVSHYSFASDFIAENELGPILDAAENKGVSILPVIVRKCGFKSSALNKYQSVNDPDIPMSELSPDKRADIWLKLVDTIEKIRKDASATQSQPTPLSLRPGQPETDVVTDTKTVEVELTIDGDFDTFSETDKARLLDAITKITEVTDLKIKRTRRGSIKVTIDLPPHLAERVKWAVKQRQLEHLNVTDAEIYDPPEGYEAPSAIARSKVPALYEERDTVANVGKEEDMHDPGHAYQYQALVPDGGEEVVHTGSAGLVMHTFHNMETVIDEVHHVFDFLETCNDMLENPSWEVVYTSKFVVHEWMANLVQHADFGEQLPLIEFSISRIGRTLKCTIEDNSKGFDLDGYFRTNRQLPDEYPDRGMGLLLAREAARELSYSTSPSGRNVFAFVI